MEKQKCPRIASNDPIYIGVSQDGVYATRTYQGSGLTTSRILLSSFAKRAAALKWDSHISPSMML